MDLLWLELDAWIGSLSLLDGGIVRLHYLLSFGTFWDLDLDVLDLFGLMFYIVVDLLVYFSIVFAGLNVYISVVFAALVWYRCFLLPRRAMCSGCLYWRA